MGLPLIEAETTPGDPSMTVTDPLVRIYKPLRAASGALTVQMTLTADDGQTVTVTMDRDMALTIADQLTRSAGRGPT